MNKFDKFVFLLGLLFPLFPITAIFFIPVDEKIKLIPVFIICIIFYFAYLEDYLEIERLEDDDI
ncbi:MAG: hypothetical protein ACNI28_09115 [Arcobacter sp.]|uniref:hypothetical protein n=1 Tax=Arcobacter sp. TaxID=1872629 RepID=UPI003AFF9DEB